MKIFLIVIRLLIIFLIFHTIRDFMQLLGFHNFITEIGHLRGIEESNRILGLVGLNYERWTEAPWIIIELLMIKKLRSISSQY